MSIPLFSFVLALHRPGVDIDIEVAADGPDDGTDADSGSPTVHLAVDLTSEGVDWLADHLDEIGRSFALGQRFGEKLFDELATPPAPAPDFEDEVSPAGRAFVREVVARGIFPTEEAALRMTGGVSLDEAVAMRREWAAAGFPALGFAEGRPLVAAGNVIRIAEDAGLLPSDIDASELWPPEPAPAPVDVDGFEEA